MAFIGRAFSKCGVDDIEDLLASVCNLCEKKEECDGKKENCWGKTVILALAAQAFVEAGPNPMIFAHLLRETLENLNRGSLK